MRRSQSSSGEDLDTIGFKYVSVLKDTLRSCTRGIGGSSMWSYGLMVLADHRCVCF